MWLYIIQGIGYGFSAAVQPGPFQTHLISQSLSRGWKKSLPAAFAPLVSDGPIIALCLLLLSQVPVWLQRFLYIAGGLFVLYLAYSAYHSWKDFNSNIPIEESETAKNILKAALVNMLSPGPYIFWSLVTGPILLTGWRETPLTGVVFLLGFYSTLILMLILIIVVFGVFQNMGMRFRRTLVGISAIALLGFGLYQVWLGIGA